MLKSSLYKRDLYLNRNVQLLKGQLIIEYDLKSANTSLCREYNLLPEEKIQELEYFPKQKRVETIGKMQRKDKEFKQKLKDAFLDIRRRFFFENDIEDGDILSVKKDAIFCLREVSHTEFGSCRFVKKNVYTSYLYANSLEFYYSPPGISGDGRIDVKGIGDNALKLHEDFMLKFLTRFFFHLENSSKKTLYGFISRFITKYKHLELDIGYYREFNNLSMVRLNDSNEMYEDPTFIPYQDRHAHLDISYNFQLLLEIIGIIL